MRIFFTICISVALISQYQGTALASGVGTQGANDTMYLQSDVFGEFVASIDMKKELPKIICCKQDTKNFTMSGSMYSHVYGTMRVQVTYVASKNALSGTIKNPVLGEINAKHLDPSFFINLKDKVQKKEQPMQSPIQERGALTMQSEPGIACIT